LPKILGGADLLFSDGGHEEIPVIVFRKGYNNSE